MSYSTFNVLQAARKARPEIKWDYVKLNDAISELMPVEYGGVWSPGRLCAYYDSKTDRIIDVVNYCLDINNCFASEDDAQIFIDKLVF